MLLAQPGVGCVSRQRWPLAADVVWTRQVLGLPRSGHSRALPADRAGSEWVSPHSCAYTCVPVCLVATKHEFALTPTPVCVTLELVLVVIWLWVGDVCEQRPASRGHSAGLGRAGGGRRTLGLGVQRGRCPVSALPSLLCFPWE